MFATTVKVRNVARGKCEVFVRGEKHLENLGCVEWSYQEKRSEARTGRHGCRKAGGLCKRI